MKDIESWEGRIIREEKETIFKRNKKSYTLKVHMMRDVAP